LEFDAITDVQVVDEESLADPVRAPLFARSALAEGVRA
jgi:hypothetical protein